VATPEELAAEAANELILEQLELEQEQQA